MNKLHQISKQHIINDSNVEQERVGGSDERMTVDKMKKRWQKKNNKNRIRQTDERAMHVQ